MNSLQGTISEISTIAGISVVQVSLDEKNHMQSIVMETPQSSSHIKIGNKVEICFKETEVIISTERPTSSTIDNCIKGQITKIRKGELLSEIILETGFGVIISICSSDRLNALDLTLDTQVFALVQSNDTMLMKI